MVLLNTLDVLLSILKTERPFIVGSFVDPLWYVVYCSVAYVYSDWLRPLLHDFITSSIYRVSQEECARLREGVPYVKVYRYNPKHLCPKLNGYGDNGQRKLWSSGGSTHCTCQLTSLIDVCSWVWCPITESQLILALYQNAQSAMLRQCLPYTCHV